MHEENQKRSSQFSILDAFLLTAASAYGLFLIPIAHAGTGSPLLTIGIMLGLSAAGTLVSYPVWRFLWPTRFTVLAVNHLGYVLTAVVLGITWDGEVIGVFPRLAAGPLSFFSNSGHASLLSNYFPLANALTGGVFVVVCLFLPIVLLMLAHTFRRNFVGVMLTSLGTAFWYLVGTGGLLVGMP